MAAVEQVIPSLRRDVVLVVALVLATLLVYSRVAGNDFINYDDPNYITKNAVVQAGLTTDGVRWAFTTGYLGNWHPLAWLSHMADVSLFGLSPSGHHATSVALHVLNTALVFILMRSATAAPFKSAMVAAVFALHPLHVESVAWISERKDLLCAFFWFLAMIAYIRYARRPRVVTYLLVAIGLGLSLLSKPMAVTLPCVLLLFDLWPLNRMDSRASVVRCAVEKLPLFAMIIAVACLTLLLQNRSDSMRTLAESPLSSRIANAFVACLMYVVKSVVPMNLAIVYPRPAGGYSTGLVAAGAALVIALGIVAAMTIRRRPYFAVGILWFLGTLVPVIGLIQVGSQAYADRYTYIPMIGLSIAIVWPLDALRLPVKAAATLAVAVLIGLTIGTWIQLGHWQNNFTLYQHAIAVTGPNANAHTNLGAAYADAGNYGSAERHSRQAIQIDPAAYNAYNNLAVVYLAQGKYDAALDSLATSLRLYPNSAGAHHNMGVAFSGKGDLPNAIASYRTALQIDPTRIDARFKLADTLVADSQFDAALSEYKTITQLHPENPAAWANMGISLANMSRFAEAIPYFEHALALDPLLDETRYYLAAALATVGQPAAARRELETVLERHPDNQAAQSLLSQLPPT